MAAQSWGEHVGDRGKAERQLVRKGDVAPGLLAPHANQTANLPGDASQASVVPSSGIPYFSLRRPALRAYGAALTEGLIMRASLYLIGFAAASIVGAGAAEIGCSSSSGGSSPEDSGTADTSTPPADTGSTEDAGGEAAACVTLDASAETIAAGATWACFQTMCTTSLTACAADCQCNSDVLGALECIASDAGSNITCFGSVAGSSNAADIAFLGCLSSMESACMVSDSGTILTDGGTPGTDAAPAADAGDGG
jgi:hypothetical protein